MTSLQKLTTAIEIYNFKTQQLRVVGTIEEPWFAAKDICDILGLSNTHQSLLNIPDKWKGICKVSTIGRGDQDMSIVNESGLYKMILRSNKPEAQPFQEWVCEDVLPSLRKKGEYVLEEYKKKLEEQQKALEEQRQIVEESQKLLQESKDILETKEKRIDHLENKVLRCKPREKSDERNCVYIMTSRYHLPERLYLIGKATTVANRKSQYDKVVKHDVVYKRPCNSARQMALIENMVLMKLSRHREVSNIDRFYLPEDKDISFFTNVVDFFVDSLADVEPALECDLELSDEQKNEKLKQYKKEYADDHKEEIKENGKIYRAEHAEEIKERTKEYTLTHKEERKEYKEKNKEAISAKEKEYREKNKEKVAEKNKAWKEKNKEKVSEYNKKYNQEHSEEISERHKKYQEENKAELEIYKEENKDEISEKKKIYRQAHLEEEVARHKKYYEEHKEDIKEKTKAYKEDCPKNLPKIPETVLCDCGIKITKACLTRHKASQIHKILFNKKSQAVECL